MIAMTGKWIAVVCGVFGFASLAVAAADFSAVLDTLKKNGLPADVWYPKSAISADFTCDGKPDLLIRGKRGQSAIVALLPSTKGGAFGTPDIIDVSVMDLKTARVVKEEQGCDGDGEPFEGCKVVRGCWNFRVERDETDSLHCWWDQRHRKVSCWVR
jgi:hypothetical protein